MRSTTNDAANRVQTSTVGRATLREVDDNHLCQECKYGDTGFSRTHSDFEMWQPLGLTSVPMKQKQQQQAQQGQQGGDGNWNKNQPKGEAAEAMVLYVGASAAHPVGLTADRRCRPYDMEPGEGGLHDAQDGKQIAYFRNRGDGADGFYVLSCDAEQQDQSGQSGAGQQAASGGGQARALYLRYASKKKQSRKPQKRQQGGALPQAGEQQQQRYKHEGDGIETQVKLDKNKIQFNDGSTVVGHYDRGGKDWLHHDGQGATHSMRADKDHSHIKHGGNHIWVDDGNCWSSKPIQIQPDPCE